ncbi:MAG: DnaB-like helicase N-terminal domain-containing protein [Dehalococcoidales bacterium]|nr:DnaB-like helicase N-terminal domain-containing protein [Dehalococcoidales bacterium]
MVTDRGRVPPYDMDAEDAVLGAILLNNSCLQEARSIIDSDDFYARSNRMIFDAMKDLAEEGIPIDAVTLGGKLIARGELDAAGGAIRFSKFADTVVTSANISYYASIVHRTYVLRKVIACAQDVVANGYEGKDPGVLSASMERLIESAAELERKHMPATMFSLGDEVLEWYRQVANGYRGIEMPWPSLDIMTAGLWPRTLTMFVARPGSGKSFIAVICARHAWMKGKKVLVISPEMDKLSMAERFFVVHSSVSYQQVVAGELPSAIEAKYSETINSLKMQDGLYIMDSEDDITPRGIDAAIRACKPDLVACDSMYDLKIKGERKDKLLAALEWIKQNSKKHRYAAVGFAQQNRVAELSEKKGGGARLGTIALADEIGQDAQTVIALEQSKDDRADKVMKFRPLKIRRGYTKKTLIKAHWDFDAMRFDEIEEAGTGESYDDIPF